MLEIQLLKELQMPEEKVSNKAENHGDPKFTLYNVNRQCQCIDQVHYDSKTSIRCELKTEEFGFGF